MLRLLTTVTVAASILAATLAPPSASAAACASSNARPAQAGRAVVSRAIFCLINAERRKHGLNVLRLDPRLSKAAQAHSRDMVRRHYFAHNTPEGLSPAHRVRRTGYLRASRRWLVGENLAWFSRRSQTPTGVVRAWMQSPPHREEILQPAFRDVGVGVVAGTPHRRRGGGTYTADFGVTR
jgi:uncharacterized protein YkwD